MTNEALSGRRPPQDGIERIMAQVKAIAGINLTEAKRPLVRNRLNKRINQLGCDLEHYADRVAEDPAERAMMIDLLTTNHTAFNREIAHFTDLQERLLPAVIARERHAAPPRLRIWCAASSTGEEPYTIARTVAQTLTDLSRWDAAILATDISHRALEKARAGTYSDEEVGPLSDAEKRQVFERRKDRWCVRRELRQLLHFAHLNLQAEWPMRGPFDAIFCRNVMIYFDNPTKERLVNRMHELLQPGGTLYVGHTESLNAIRHPHHLLRPSVYIKKT